MKPQSKRGRNFHVKASLSHVMGFGLFWTWNFCIFWSDAILGNPYITSFGEAARVTSLISIAVSLMLCSYFNHLINGNLRLVSIVVTISATVGMLFYLLISFVSSYWINLLLCILGSFLIGFAFSGMELLWSYSYQFIKQDEAWNWFIPVSLLVGAAVFVATLLLPNNLRAVAALVLPAISMLFCSSSVLYQNTENDRGRSLCGVCSTAKMLTARFLLCVGLYGLALGFVTEITLGMSVLPWGNAISFVSASVVLVGVIILSRLKSVIIGFRFVHYVLLPLIATALVVTATSANWLLQEVAAAVIVVGLVLGELYIWALLSARSKLSRGVTIAVFGVGQAAKVFGLCFGMTLAYGLTNRLGLSVSFIAMMMLYALVLAALFMHNALSVTYLEDKLVARLENDLDNTSQPQGLPALFRTALDSQCREMAERYCLSERERQTLELLVTGNGLKAIADYLGVSENTAKAHAKHIYQKMCIHSRQELINAFRNEMIRDEYIF